MESRDLLKIGNGVDHKGIINKTKAEEIIYKPSTYRVKHMTICDLKPIYSLNSRQEIFFTYTSFPGY